MTFGLGRQQDEEAEQHDDWQEGEGQQTGSDAKTQGTRSQDVCARTNQTCATGS